MKKVIYLSLVMCMIFCVLLVVSSCDSTEKASAQISSERAIELAKNQFELSLENSSKYSKTFMPSYGRCTAQKSEDEKYWIVTLKGNFDYYTDDYASGLPKNETFEKTYHMPVDSDQYITIP